MKSHAAADAAASSSPAASKCCSVGKFSKHLPSTIYVLVIFSLGYTLGLLSASQPPPEPQIPAPEAHFPSGQVRIGIPPVTSAAASTKLPVTSAMVSSQIFAPEVTSAAAVSAPPHDLLRFNEECGAPVAPADVIGTLTRRLYDGASPFDGFPSAETAGLLLPASARPRGWGSTMPVFRELIAAVRPRVIVELGTFLGASALHMAAVTAELGLNETVVLCVDDFRGWPAFRQKFRRDVPAGRHGDALLMQQFMAGVAAAGEDFKRRILPVPFSTASALAALCEWGVYGDLIEVDAGHDFHSAWADVNMAWAVLRPGGVLFGHDWHTAADNKGVRRAVVLFARTKGVEITPNGQHWVLSPKPW